MTCSFGSVPKRGPSRSSEDLLPLRASKRCACAILLTRLSDLHNSVPAAGDPAANPELALLGVDRDGLEVAHGGRLVAHLSRHPLALEETGRGGRGAGRAWRPHVVRAVAHRAAPEAVPLDRALEALALGGGANVDPVAHLEDVGADGAADLARDAAPLPQVPARRGGPPGDRA